MNNLTSNLRNKVELWGNVPFKNELGENDFKPGKLKDIYTNIIPAALTGNIYTGQANIQYAEVTHKIKCRKLSIPNLSIDMYFKDSNGLKYEILYFQPDYKYSEFWEILAKVVYE